MSEPDTDCEECWQAEASTAQKIRAALRRPDPVFAAMAGLSMTVSIMMGCPSLSWYERHRDAWAATGDPAELQRMLRHVT